MIPAHRKTKPDRHRRQIRLSRDSLLFLAGLAGVAHETLIANVERPTLLLLFAAMIGLPAFLRHDEQKQKKDPPPDHLENDQ
jgi:hypothetical protein